MDINRISLGGKIVAIAGLLFFIDSFLPWHRSCFEFLGTSSCGGENAWGTIFSLLATLIVIALVAEVLYVEGAGNSLAPVGSVTWDQIRLGAAALALALVVLQLIVGDSGLDRAFGIFIGVVLAAAIVYGQFLRTRSSATSGINL